MNPDAMRELEAASRARSKERLRQRPEHERQQIHFALKVAVLQAAGHSQSTTARILGVPSTVRAHPLASFAGIGSPDPAR
jgi:hypothetical protein